jgi:Ni/Co efflux regulator RcnB
MTLESCEIIQISAFTRPARPVSDKQPPAEATAIGNRLLTPRQRRREVKPELPPPVTETAKNSRIRIARRDAWRRARLVSEYWRGPPGLARRA